jgi:hypothetical protein
LKVSDENQAELISKLFRESGVQAERTDSGIAVKGDLFKVLSSSLEDSDHLFQNQSQKVRDKHGIEERKVLYHWWLGLKALEKELTRQKRFLDAKFVTNVLNRGVECSYNYYNIIPVNISDEVVMVILSLIFYVIYTVWFGYAIMYFLLGLGFQIES